jgi:hypothetical protein
MVSTPEQDEEAPAPGDIQSAAPVEKKMTIEMAK